MDELKKDSEITLQEIWEKESAEKGRLLKLRGEHE